MWPMKKQWSSFIKVTAVCVAAVSLIAVYQVSASREKAPTVTVYAAASAADALNEIAREYERIAGVKVQLNCAASSTLAKQIEAGAPADIFLSADAAWMDYLGERKLVQPGTRSDLLGNRLVIVALKTSPLTVRMEKSFSLAGAFDGRLAVGDPQHVPAGRYAREALTSLGWWYGVKDRLAVAMDVRGALRFVETGEAAAGIVYATDALASDKVCVVATFPLHACKPIRYPVALCSRATPPARDFLAYLHSEAAGAVFTCDGFDFLSSGLPVSNSMASTTAMNAENASAIWLSLKVALWCSLAVAVPGIAAGWLLARKRFPGKALLGALVHAPMVVPPVVVGYVTLVTLGRNSLVGRFLEQAWGVRLAFTWQGAALVSAIMALPLMVRSVRLAVEMVDRRLEGAASALGASPLRAFVTITLPLALPGVLGGLVLAFARSLGEFGATITFAGNTAGQTRTLPLAIYTWTQTPGGDGQAMMLAAVSVLLSVGAIGVSEWLARRATRVAMDV